MVLQVLAAQGEKVVGGPVVAVAVPGLLVAQVERAATVLW